MCSAYQVKAKFLVERLNNIVAEDKTDSAVIRMIAPYALFRVRPQQVTQQTLVGHITRPIDPVDSVQVIQVVRNASVGTENLLIYNGSNLSKVIRESSFLNRRA